MEAGLFDEPLLTSEDFLLLLKIGSKNILTRVPEVLAFYHFHDGIQATRNKERVALNLWYAQKKFLQQNPEIVPLLGKRKIRQLMHGELLRRGFECYWKHDLKAARTIFRKVMMQGYGALQNWKYMLPSILPFSLHKILIYIINQ